MLSEAVERHAVTDICEAASLRCPGQQRIELVLRTPLTLLRGGTGKFTLMRRGDRGAADEVTEQRCGVDGVTGKVCWVSDCRDFLDEPPASAHLHRALVETVRLGQEHFGGARVALDQRRAD